MSIMDTVTEQVFSSHEVCRRAGITYRQLDYWCREAVIRPTVPADGSGSKRQWGAAQIAVVKILGRLSQLGVSMQAFRTAAEELGELDLRGVSWVVVAGDGSVEVARDLGGISSALERVPEASWVVPVAA